MEKKEDNKMIDLKHRKEQKFKLMYGGRKGYTNPRDIPNHKREKVGEM